MFERRLKIFLGVMGAVVLLLILRSVQLQLLAADFWRDRASSLMRRTQLTETTRGSILDYRGREVAVDAACIDLCVDYRAIGREPDEQWVENLARSRLRRRRDPVWDKGSAEERKALLEQEKANVRAQIEIMWDRIARMSGRSIEEIDEIRQAIVQRVELRRRYVWYHNYRQALLRYQNREPAPWYRQWLRDDAAEAPQLDSFAVTVREQVEPHVIIRDFIDYNNELGKNIDQYPGLVLRPGKHRVYPYGEVGAHLVGHLGSVNREDLANDPFADDELKAYLPNDLIGRGGIEGLCEPILRGSRGRIERESQRDQIVSQVDPVPGESVHMTIDMELQRDIHAAFAQRREYRNRQGLVEELREHQHGAAVVIDVPTGQVRAMVSYPSFDPNKFDELYNILIRDDLNRPLFHRATMSQLVPGSTIKPVIGAGAITDGFIGYEEGIECTGYLVINGRTYRTVFRCWVASQFEHLGIKVAHHPYPVPHPTGFLNVADGLERSCNVVFETLADRMGPEALVKWLDRFGLGRVTGIGIPEARGRIPDPKGMPKPVLWSAGIGQGEVAVTPLQMANVAATIARGGMWMRPRLVLEELAHRKSDVPERVDLKMSPEAVAALKEGMYRTANSPAGTLDRSHIGMLGGIVAAKTGSAQTGRLSIPLRDEHGELVLKNGRRVMVPVELGTPGTETWYVGVGPEKNRLAHAWVIGFAPVDNPQVAFCVLVEYGGSGGKVAGDIAQSVLEACVKHGYLSPGEKWRGSASAR